MSTDSEHQRQSRAAHASKSARSERASERTIDELPSARHGEIYFPLTCSSQLLALPWPFRNGRAASTICGAMPIS
jgi:hypothetical protein